MQTLTIANIRSESDEDSLAKLIVEESLKISRGKEKAEKRKDKVIIEKAINNAIKNHQPCKQK